MGNPQGRCQRKPLAARWTRGCLGKGRGITQKPLLGAKARGERTLPAHKRGSSKQACSTAPPPPAAFQQLCHHDFGGKGQAHAPLPSLKQFLSPNICPSQNIKIKLHSRRGELFSSQAHPSFSAATKVSPHTPPSPLPSWVLEKSHWRSCVSLPQDHCLCERYSPLPFYVHAHAHAGSQLCSVHISRGWFCPTGAQ